MFCNPNASIRHFWQYARCTLFEFICRSSGLTVRINQNPDKQGLEKRGSSALDLIKNITFIKGFHEAL